MATATSVEIRRASAAEEQAKTLAEINERMSRIESLVTPQSLNGVIAALIEGPALMTAEQASSIIEKLDRLLAASGKSTK